MEIDDVEGWCIWHGRGGVGVEAVQKVYISRHRVGRGGRLARS